MIYTNHEEKRRDHIKAMTDGKGKGNSLKNKKQNQEVSIETFKKYKV